MLFFEKFCFSNLYVFQGLIEFLEYIKLFYYLYFFKSLVVHFLIDFNQEIDIEESGKVTIFFQLDRWQPWLYSVHTGSCVNCH